MANPNALQVTITAWRALLVAFCILMLAQEAGTIPLTLHSVGVAGVSVTGAIEPFEWRIGVAPDSPAYAAGLRSGDTIDAKQLTPAERFRLWSGYWEFGKLVHFAVLRDGALHTASVMPRHQEFEWALWLAIAAGLWTGLCALVLVWRKPESWEVRILVVWLLSVRLSIQMAPPNWVTSSPAADAANNVIGNLFLAGWVLMATYVSSFPAGRRWFPRSLAAAAYALAAYTVLVATIPVIAAWYGFIDPEGGLFTGAFSEYAQAAYFILPIVCAIVVFAGSGGAERERIGWVAGSASVYYLIGIAYFVPLFSGPLYAPAILTITLVVQILTPLGLTYAMLNRRLLDLGFVLNRAAVYGVVSIIVIGIFVLVEWAFSEWFSSATHAENLMLSAGLALGLGLSIRAIHHQADKVLDNVFFRKRHDDEQALRHFAREAPYITDTGTLIVRTIAVLEKHAGAASVAIECADHAGHYGNVDENDEAVVSLRAFHRVLDLSEVTTGLPGEFAYPMVARGRLIGVLCLGGKRSGESYAPDESAAIETLAHNVGSAIDVLALKNAGSHNVVVEEIRHLEATLTLQLTKIAQRLDASDAGPPQ